MSAKHTAHRPRIRRGDTVQVITGADRGSRGRVLRIVPNRDKVVVEGVNLVYRHVRRSQKNPQGGRVRREAPVDISNVMLIDPSGDNPTKVGRRRAAEGDGSLGWVRVARKTGEVIDVAAGKAGKKSKGKKGKE